jgi:hypothetical protein
MTINITWKNNRLQCNDLSENRNNFGNQNVDYDHNNFWAYTTAIPKKDNKTKEASSFRLLI